MPGVNSVTLIGYLGKDPEVQYTSSGRAVAKVNLATTEKWRDRTENQKREHTEWHRLVFWEGKADLVAKYCRKGSLLYVTGRLRTQKWEREGQTHYTTEILVDNMQFLDFSGQRAAAPGAAAPAAPAAPQTGNSNAPFDDDIPF